MVTRSVPLLVPALLAIGLVADVRAEPVVLVGSHLMKLVDDTIEPIYPGKRRFNWRVRSGNAPVENQVVIPDAESDGDPRLHGATFTIYNAVGSGEWFSVDLPAEGWIRTGNPTNGYRYIFTAPPPIEKIWLKGSKITLKGGRAPWGYSLDEPSQGALAVRLTLGTGVTWCTVALPNTAGTPPSSEKFDRQNLFRAQRLGAPPAECPPVPAP